MDISEIGSIIRFHRKAAGLTQRELADLAGVGKTAVFDLEKGKETVQIQTAMAMLAALNMQLLVNGPLLEQYYRKSGKEG